MKNRIGALALVLFVVGLSGCFDRSNNYNFLSGLTGPSSTSPDPPAASCMVDRIRVGLFGNCGAPDGIVPVGCNADGTATPLLKDGEKAPQGVHGNDIRLEIVEGSGAVDFSVSGDNFFNFHALGRASGAFKVRATLRAPGCPTPIIGETSGLRVQ